MNLRAPQTLTMMLAASLEQHQHPATHSHRKELAFGGRKSPQHLRQPGSQPLELSTSPGAGPDWDRGDIHWLGFITALQKAGKCSFEDSKSVKTARLTQNTLPLPCGASQDVLGFRGSSPRESIVPPRAAAVPRAGTEQLPAQPAPCLPRRGKQAQAFITLQEDKTRGTWQSAACQEQRGPSNVFNEHGQEAPPH